MRKKLNFYELYKELTALKLFTHEELKLLVQINGFSIETLNDAIFARYGYRDYEQMMEG